jgi:hypothetical protein
MIDRYSNYMIRIIISILVMLFFVCGCTQKPPEGKPDVPVEPEKTDEDELRDFPEGYPELPEEPGNSAALSYSPLEGFYVEAEENAFWEDTTITMEPAKTATEAALASVHELIEDGNYPLGIYEIDAGLDDEDVIPGEYTVSVDPAVFDIDPRFYPCIRVYRIGDNGGYYECVSKYSDGKIVYRANQNCIIFYSISTGLVLATLITTYSMEEGRSLRYFYENNKNQWYAYERKNDYATYRLMYAMEDMDKDLAPVVKRMEEITESYNKKAVDLFEAYAEDFREEKDELLCMIEAQKKANPGKFIEDAINSDSEFQELKKQLYTPEIITKIADYTDLAFSYLKEQENVKMPLFVVDIICTPRKGDPSQAESTTRNVLHAGYIELNLSKVLQGNVDAGYNLLLTMTHELLHVCQERYRCFWADAVRYDEMVAANMEQRCWDYFVKEGKIPKGLSLEMAPTDRWCTLTLSIDSDQENNNEILKYQGYLLSRFIEYLSEKTGKHPDAGTLMNARISIIEPGITMPLKGVFKIPEKEIDAHYTYFVRKYREEMATRYNNGNYEFYYTEPTILAKGGKYRVDMRHYTVEGEKVIMAKYSSYIMGFRQPDTAPMTLLLVLDDDIHYQLPELLVIPYDKYKTFRKGAYIGAVDKDTLLQNRLHRNILNIHGYFKYKSDDKGSGYTIYVFNKTGKPGLSEDKDSLIISLPKNSVLADDKAIEGYLLRLEVKDGQTFDIELGQEYFEKEYTLEKKDIYGDRDIKEPLSITATLCEYVKDKDGNRMLGETSDPVSYVINEGTAPDSKDLVWAVDTLVYVTHSDNFAYVDEQYENHKPCSGCVFTGYDKAEYDYECGTDSCTLTSTIYGSEPEIIKKEIKFPPTVFNDPKQLDEWAIKQSENAIVQIAVYTAEDKEWGKSSDVIYSSGKKFGNAFEEVWPEANKDKTVLLPVFYHESGGLALVYRAMDRKDAQSVTRKHVEMDMEDYFNKGEWK